MVTRCEHLSVVPDPVDSPPEDPRVGLMEQACERLTAAFGTRATSLSDGTQVQAGSRGRGFESERVLSVLFPDQANGGNHCTWRMDMTGSIAHSGAEGDIHSLINMVLQEVDLPKPRHNLVEQVWHGVSCIRRAIVQRACDLGDKILQ